MCGQEPALPATATSSKDAVEHAGDVAQGSMPPDHVVDDLREPAISAKAASRLHEGCVLVRSRKVSHRGIYERAGVPCSDLAETLRVGMGACHGGRHIRMSDRGSCSCNG